VSFECPNCKQAIHSRAKRRCPTCAALLPTDQLLPEAQLRYFEKLAARKQPISTIRKILLACAAGVVFLALLVPLIDIVLGKRLLDDIPNWLGFLITIFIAWCIFMEFRIFYSQPTRDELRDRTGSQNSK